MSLTNKKEPPVKRMHSLVSDSIEKDTLIHCYTDIKGNNYYEFPDAQSMSVLRYISATEAIKYSEMNVPFEKYLEYLEKGKKALNQREPDLMTIAQIFYELENRAKFAGEKTCLLNLACVYFIREDENPIGFENKTQLSKLADWEADPDAQAFFLQRAWQTTNNYANYLDLDIVNYLKEMDAKAKFKSNQFRT